MDRNSSKEISPWQGDLWNRMQDKLAALSINELKLLATRCGIVFTGGIDALSDKPWATVKAQIIGVLEEVEPDELLREYEKIQALAA